ncbi:MAG: ABC transporter permease [Bilophila sp.]
MKRLLPDLTALIRNTATHTRSQCWLTGLFLLLLSLFMLTGARAFLSWPMHESLLSTLPLYGFLALGLTLVVAAGEMDLCFPSTVALAGLGFAVSATLTGQVFIGVLAAVGIGLGVGVINGFIVAYVGVPSIIATIGTQFFWRGVVMLLSQGLALGLDRLDGTTHALLVGRLGGMVPAQCLWLLLLAGVLWVALNRHPVGDAIRFTGEQAEIASRLGINVPLARMGVHTLMGGMAGFAGAVSCLEMGSWWPTQGEGYMLLVFAAVFIGGTSVYGGAGRVYGTLVGIAIVGMIEAGIVSSGFSGFWTRAVHGFVIVLAVSCYAILSDNTDERFRFFLRRWKRTIWGNRRELATPSSPQVFPQNTRLLPNGSECRRSADLRTRDETGL